MPVDPKWKKWYGRAHWRKLRTLVLARDPVCMICLRNPSVCADHKRPHRGDWNLFASLENLQGLCSPCHDEKTEREDGAFGHAPRAYVPSQKVGVVGSDDKRNNRLFISSTVSTEQINKAMNFDAAELLKDIPE